MPIQSSAFLLLIAGAGGYAMVALFTRLLFQPVHPKKFAGFRLQGFFPSVIPGISDLLAGAAGKYLQSSQQLEKTIDDPALLEQLRPELEDHIDLFLRDKLPSAFPLLANMMGEKTKATLKSAFLEEVETIFPAVMKSFSGKLMDRLQPVELIQKKLADIDWKGLEKIVHDKARRQILMMKFAGAAAGLFIGLLQLICLHYLG